MRANFRGKTAAGLQGIWDLFFSAPLDAVLWGIVRPHCCDKEGRQYGMYVFKVADSAESPTCEGDV